MNSTIFEASVEKKNYLPGAIGAILGAVIGSVPWALASMAGWFVAWLGFLIGFLSKKGYELFGGKIGRPKIWIICCAAVFGVIFGSILPDFIEFGQLIYTGELIGFTFSDIPSLYLHWVRNPAVLRSELISLAVGMLFGLMGLISVFREMTAELKPKPTASASDSANDQYALESADPAEDEGSNFQFASPKKFTVSYPRRASSIMFGVVLAVVIIAFVAITFAAAASGVSMAEATGIMVPIFLGLFLLIVLPIWFYIRGLKKWKIEVNGNELQITSMLGSINTIACKEITKVIKSGGPANSVVRAYANGKKLFQFFSTCDGAAELEALLKAKKIPFTSSPFRR